MKRLSILFLGLVLAACNYPKQPTATIPFTPGSASTQCAFVEGRQALPELSGRFIGNLKNAALPIETARAEAYGENCVAADNSVVRFTAMETDFYVTLDVASLGDEAALGQSLEKILLIIDNIPADQMGPNPGYIGVTFKAGEQVKNLWFTRTRAKALEAQGLKGADLYTALSNQP